jgi:hypothetical protein
VSVAVSECADDSLILAIRANECVATVTGPRVFSRAAENEDLLASSRGAL